MTCFVCPSRFALCLAVLPALPAIAQDVSELPAGTYALDPSHTSVSFEVRHLGLSNYTGGFDTISGTLDIDPADPGSANLVARIETRSLDLPAPPEGFFDEMMSEVWFNAGAHPDITFESDTVTPTGETTADITGTLTLLGVTAPVALKATFNGAFPAGVIEPHPRIGFSATTSLERSSFGMTFGVPPEGSDFGVGDLVTIRIEVEFTGPTAP